MEAKWTSEGPLNSRARLGLAGALVLLVATMVAGLPAGVAVAGSGSASNGPRTVTVSEVSNLDPNGTHVRVTGSGFDDFKGIYVALCVVPPTGQLPSPCGGGIDLTGSLGAAQWISSNPPPYGEGLAIPYGPGGSFDVTVGVSAVINGTADCRRVQCAIVTRNDHTRTGDRDQDVFVPISFAAPPATTVPPTAPPTAPPTPPIVTTTVVATTQPPTSPPTSEVVAETTPVTVPPTTAPAATTSPATTTTTSTTTPASTTSVADSVPSSTPDTTAPGSDGGAPVGLLVGGGLAVAGAGGVAWWRLAARRRAGLPPELPGS